MNAIKQMKKSINKTADFYLECAIRNSKSSFNYQICYWLALVLKDLGLSEDDATEYLDSYVKNICTGDYTKQSLDMFYILECVFKDAQNEPLIISCSEEKGFSLFNVNDRPEQHSEIIRDMQDFDLTESGNADAFKYLFSNQFIYIPQKRSWFRWDGLRWVNDNEGAKSAMLRTTNKRHRVAQLFSHSQDDFHKEMLRWTKSSKNLRIIENSIKMAGWRSKQSYADFDQNPYLLACANGAIDLINGEFQPPRPNNFILKSCGVKFDPHASCDRWEKFLQEIFNSDKEIIDFIWRAIGYTLTGSTNEHCIFICYGNGANGKSTFLKVLEKLLGDYSIETPSSTFKRKRSGNGIPNDIARMCGVRLVKCSEISEGDYLDEERIKAMSGGDTLAGRFLYGEFYDFTPTHKIWWAVNHKPRIKGVDDGIWRRIRLIPFEVHFSENEKTPQEKLLNELYRELPGILNWAVKGCLEWKKRRLESIGKIQAATNEYRKEIDIIGRYLDERIIKEPGNKIQAKDLYEDFVKWCKNNHEKEITFTAFGLSLKRRGLQKETSALVYYLGIKLQESQSK